MGFTDPASAVLYGNNTGQLSFYNDGSAPDDLKKIAFKAEKGSDGIFNEGDYLLFYAEGTHRWIYNRDSWQYEFLRHHYSDTAWYFITSRAGRGCHDNGRSGTCSTAITAAHHHTMSPSGMRRRQ